MENTKQNSSRTPRGEKYVRIENPSDMTNRGLNTT